MRVDQAQPEKQVIVLDKRVGYDVLEPDNDEVDSVSFEEEVGEISVDRLLEHMEDILGVRDLGVCAVRALDDGRSMQLLKVSAGLVKIGQED